MPLHLRTHYRRRMRPLLVLSLGLAGCLQPDSGDSRITQIQQLEDRIESQNRELIQQKSQIAEQARQIQTLQGLSEPDRLARLVHVDKIRLQSLSGGYDDDRDGIDDGAVAYLQLLDAQGDVIKAAGSVVMEVFDLAAPDAERQVLMHQLGPEELAATWFGRFMTSHYSIKAPWPSGRMPAHKSLTIVVRFTELLTGESFEVQLPVKVNGPAL
ncbi:hypothetical protein B7486_09570 [cyanobacterium TDX16]|nr:hypothetical protein B7486_09570 [cyanobacterium TDX16]